MYPSYSTLTPTCLYDYVAALVEPYLQWHDYGPKCTVRTLLQVLFYAAGHVCSVFTACGRLRAAPSDQAVRNWPTWPCSPLVLSTVSPWHKRLDDNPTSSIR
jgi:hypothetical protein